MQERVGRYNILRQLGRGGMGSVYLAADPVLNRQVAVKMVDLSEEEVSRRAFFRERLLRDAKAAALLSHPNVVGVFDVIEEGDSAFVVMEYIPGESLTAYLERIPIPGTAFTVSVLRQIASALDYTHTKGIIHRDIKPSNVMTSPDGAVKILDFGIARMSGGRTSTPTDVVMGTVEYMSPEQVKGESLDGRSDQFSMAGVAYRMLTGGTLFGEQTMATLAYKLVTETPALASVRNAALPPGVDEVLNKALSKSPSDRFRTCSEFAEALQQVFLDAPAEATHTVIRTQPLVLTKPQSESAPVANKRMLFTWMAAATCVALLAAGMVFWKPWNRAQDAATADMRKVASSAQPGQIVPAPAGQAPASQPVKQTPTPPAEAKTLAHAEAGSRSALEKGRTIPPDSAKPAGQMQSHRPPGTTPAPLKPRPVSPVDPDELARIYSKGQDQVKQRDFTDAIQSFTAAIAISPDFQKAYFSRGLARQLADQCEAAIEDLSRAIKLGPQDAPSYLRRGMCLVRTRQDEPALADFNRALEIKADMPLALNGRGGIHLRRRNYAEAIRDFDAALRINPRLAQAYANRARAKRALGNITGADEDLRKFEELKGEIN